MKWLLLSTIITSCTPYYTAVVISKGTSMGQLEMETQVSEHFYIRPDLTVEQWDTIQWHDTIKINKRTLKLWQNEKKKD